MLEIYLVIASISLFIYFFFLIFVIKFHDLVNECFLAYHRASALSNSCLVYFYGVKKSKCFLGLCVEANYMCKMITS